MQVKNIYAEFRDEAKWAFVPAEKGRWIRTHPSALFEHCKECKASAGHPCLNLSGREIKVYQVPVHGARKLAFDNRRFKKLDTEGRVLHG